MENPPEHDRPQGAGGTLTHAEARYFYDRLGVRQDWQSFYERKAVERLCANADLGRARALVELGPGTGRLAEHLLAHHLPADATYLGLELSGTMAALARDRTSRFGARADIRQTDGQIAVPAGDGAFDRLLACYVVDLLSADEARALVTEAARVLAPGGLLCTVSLTVGETPISRGVSRAWAWVHARRPVLVGGCRPIRVRDLLPPEIWSVRHLSTLSSYGVPSEVLIAERTGF